MVIGTSRCAHVLCCLFCWRAVRAHPKARCARSPLTYPARRRCAALEQKLAAGSLLWRIAEWDAAKHPAPEEYPLGQRSRRIHRSRSTQPPLEAVRRPTLAFGNRHMSAPVRRYVAAPWPKSRAGSRLSLPAPNRWSLPPALSGDRRSPGRLDRLAAHLQIVGTGQRRARHRRAIQIEDRGRGDVVVQWSVTAPRHPAERLDVHSQVGVEVNRVEEMPAVHPEALLAPIQPIRADDLMQPEKRRRIGGVTLPGHVEVPGAAEVVLGAGAADRGELLVAVEVELHLALTPPAG